MFKKLFFLAIIVLGAYVLLQIPPINEYAKELKASTLDKYDNVAIEVERVKGKYDDVKETVDGIGDKVEETKGKIDSFIEWIQGTKEAIDNTAESIGETIDKVKGVFGDDESDEGESEEPSADDNTETEE